MRLAISRCIRGSSINNILTYHIGNNATTVLYYRRRISLFHWSNLH